MPFPVSPAPNHIEETSRDFPVEITTFKDGGVSVRSLTATKKREFNLIYIGLSGIEYNSFRDFWDQSKGKLTAFTWAHPRTSENIQVRMWDFRKTRFSTLDPWSSGASIGPRLDIVLREEL